jgi:uncharacterized membrane protein YkoI
MTLHCSRTATVAALAAFALSFAAAAAAPAWLKVESAALLQRAKVTPEAARATAQARFAKARIVSAELEVEDGKLLYSFDLRTKGKSGVDEVDVDALTGAIVSVKHETPAEVAREKAQDAAAK